MFWVDAELGSDVYLDGELFFFSFATKCHCLCVLVTGTSSIIWSGWSLVVPRLTGSTCRD